MADFKTIHFVVEVVQGTWERARVANTTTVMEVSGADPESAPPTPVLVCDAHIDQHCKTLILVLAVACYSGER